MYLRAIDTPVHYQWDMDSRFPLPDPGSAPDNCGPTSVSNVAHFYLDWHLGIYSTRLLAAAPLGPTSVTDQRTMLEKRGVPCMVGRWSVATIRKVVAGGTHPLILGLYYAAVPYDVAGHPFRGWHSIEVLDVAVRNGVDGVLVRDPNFNRTYRTDPTNGRRFYPDWVIQQAFVNQANAWGIMPTSPKAVKLPDTALPEDELPVDLFVPKPPHCMVIERASAERKGRPSFSAPKVRPNNDGQVGTYVLLGYTKGEAYGIGGGKTSRKWAVRRVQSDDDAYKGYFAYTPAVYIKTKDC